MNDTHVNDTHPKPITTIDPERPSSAPAPFATHLGSCHRRRHAAGVLLLAVLGVLALGASSAQAVEEAHIYSSSFGGEGSGPGQFDEPAGVAVNDQAGEVYVVDRGNDRVEAFVFNSVANAYEYAGEFDGASAPTGRLSAPTSIAVDNSTNPLDPSKGDVYVTDNGHRALDKFSASGTYLGQITKAVCPEAMTGGRNKKLEEEQRAKEKAECPPGQEALLGELNGVAVDGEGHLWVSQSRSSGAIDDYSNALANVFLAARILPPECNQVTCSPSSVFAVGPEDDFYTNIVGGLVVQRFTSAGVEVSFPPGASGATGIAVDLSSKDNELYVDRASSVAAIDAFTPPTPEVPVEVFGAGHLHGGVGVAVGATEELMGGVLNNSVYVADAPADVVRVFDYLVIPELTSQPASGIEVVHEGGHALVAATLHGKVQGGGVAVSSCEFEYGTTTSYGHSVPCEPAPGSGETSVSAKVTGLLPLTTYHFRLRAANANDESAPEVQLERAGADESFAVPFGPSVVSEAPAAEVTVTTATVSGEVNPGELQLSECKFEYGTSASYGHSAPCEHPDAEEAGEGTAPVQVHADLKGLEGVSTYHFRLVASTEDLLTKEKVTVTGKGLETFQTLPVPVLSGGEALDVTETSAELSTQLNPEGLPVTKCYFEYGTSISYGQTASCEQRKSEIGSGTAPLAVTTKLTGLSPNTEYHWRLIALDANGSSLQAPGGSPDHTFVYPLAASTGACPDEQARAERNSTALPDCRAYEMVTPPDKNGALIDDLFLDQVAPQISSDGRRVVVPSTQCFAQPESCIGVRRTEGDPYEFTRTAGGWVARGLAPPASSYESNSWTVLSSTGSALFEVPSVPESLTDDWLARTETGSLVNIGPLGEHAGEPPFANVAPDYLALSPGATIATADLSHVVYQTEVPLWAFDKNAGGTSDSAGLYEYAGAASEPLLVGVKGGYQSHELISACGTHYGKPPNLISRDRLGGLSSDGRVVYFTAERTEGGCTGTAPPADELYARVDGEQPDARSAPISVNPPTASCEREPCKKNAASGFEDAAFEGASADGSSVFFTDTQQLTDDASQSSETAVKGCWTFGGAGDCNLYESYCPHCQELTGEQEAGRRELIDVSETNAHTAAAGGPRVQGLVTISEDGSHVYFVAKGVLTGEQENENHEHAEDGAENLYMYADGTRAFIAQLSPKTPKTDVENSRIDRGEWADGFLRANATPDGRFLLFTSTRALTADDTREEGPSQVYEYDAQTRRLLRASIGEQGYGDDGNAGEGNAAIVPVEARTGAASVPVRTDPSMSNDGQYVFFQSPIALTPGALNDVRIGGGEGALDEGFAQNVYEYHGGHVYLISREDATGTPGGDGEGLLSPVELFGTDTEGKNVFFATFDSLLPEDTDTQRDYYDARVCSESEPCAASQSPPGPSCEGEACQGNPPPEPVFGTPGGSATYNGAGNLAPSAPATDPAKPKAKRLTRAQLLAKALTACHRDRAKATRRRCEATARRRYVAAHKTSVKHKAKGSSSKRAAGR